MEIISISSGDMVVGYNRGTYLEFPLAALKEIKKEYQPSFPPSLPPLLLFLISFDL